MRSHFCWLETDNDPSGNGWRATRPDLPKLTLEIRLAFANCEFHSEGCVKAAMTAAESSEPEDAAATREQSILLT
jgi:hypothetical protein